MVTPVAPRPVKKEFAPEALGHPEGVDGGRWRHKAGELADKAAAALLKSEKALSWLAARGIDRAAAAEFGLGLVTAEKAEASGIFRSRAAWGLPDEKSEKTGRAKALWIPRGIVIPYRVDGQVVRLRVRRPNADVRPGAAKYYVVPGSRMDRTLVNAAAPVLVVVETELDALMVATLAGVAGENVGALAMGTSHAKPDAAAHAALERAVKILVALDADSAGAGGAAWWRATYRQAVRWPVPSGKDPGDAFAAGVDIAAWVRAGLPPALRIAAEKKAPAAAAVPLAQKEPAVEAPDGPEASAAPGVRALYRALASYPIWIENSAKRTAVETPPNWHRWDVARAVGALLFRDADVQAFLAAHPDAMIARKNFWAGIEAGANG
jgi:hypothetical protein